MYIKNSIGVHTLVQNREIVKYRYFEDFPKVGNMLILYFEESTEIYWQWV